MPRQLDQLPADFPHRDRLLPDEYVADCNSWVEPGNTVIVGPDGAETLPLQSKSRVAAEILDRVEQMLARNPAKAGSHT